MTTVRPATASDIPELVRLWLLMSDAPTPEKESHLNSHLSERIGNGNGLEAFVVDAETGLAACVAAVVVRGIGRKRGHVHLVVTDPAHRRQGYAKTLMGSLIERLRELECTRIELSSSQEGVPLYASLGFVPETVWRLKTDGFS